MIATAFLFALVLTLPFELQVFPIFSNLQWLFAVLAVSSVPALFRNRYRLASDRRVIAAGIFVVVQWIAVLSTPQFELNASKALVRVAAGFTLLCIAMALDNRERLARVWCIAAVAASVYGIVDYLGYGAPSFFRNAEFYVGDVRRLSGSFEYPNTAAAYFAMTLPLVWVTLKKSLTKFVASGLIAVALILTYSRGAMAAVALISIVWALRAKSRSPLLLLGSAAGLYLLLALIQPFLFRRLQEIKPDKALAAEYRPEFNLMRHRPRAMDRLKVTVTNVGAETWLPEGENPVTLSYHWYDTEHKRLATVAATQTPVPRAVSTRDSVEVDASFFTPHEPGSYLLIWDLAQKGRGWFSASGVVPAVVETNIRPENQIWHGNGDVSRWYRTDKPPAADAAITRSELWKAAVGLARRRPLLGYGPDNFRLLYGSQLGFSSWDTNVRSNSLYLELLVGSGIVGLLSFAGLIASIPRYVNPSTLAIGVFLLHGIVDVFLMTTPIYFAFWILMGWTDDGWK